MAPGTQPQIDELRRYFNEALGTETLRLLHRERPLLDAFAAAGLLAAFVGLAVALGTLPFGLAWCACAVVQGCVLMMMALAGHDLMHREAFRPSVRRWLLLALMLPVYRSPSRYRLWHGIHHAQLGTPADSEQFKTDIRSRWQRLAYATVLGEMLPHRVLFPQPADAPARVVPDSSAVARDIRRDAVVARWFTLAWLALAFVQPRIVVFGYLLPLIVVTPLASTVRTVIEHTEYDAGNPFQIGCYYRTNFLSRLLFFWDSGDCHLVHHVYPRIPFYGIGPALRVMHPHFLAHGVRERRHLLPLVGEWFSGARPYLSTRPDTPARHTGG